MATQVDILQIAECITYRLVPCDCGRSLYLTVSTGSCCSVVMRASGLAGPSASHTASHVTRECRDSRSCAHYMSCRWSRFPDVPQRLLTLAFSHSKLRGCGASYYTCCQAWPLACRTEHPVEVSDSMTDVTGESKQYSNKALPLLCNMLRHLIGHRGTTLTVGQFRASSRLASRSVGRYSHTCIHTSPIRIISRVLLLPLIFSIAEGRLLLATER